MACVSSQVTRSLKPVLEERNNVLGGRPECTADLEVPVELSRRFEAVWHQPPDRQRIWELATRTILLTDAPAKRLLLQEDLLLLQERGQMELLNK